MHNTAGTHAQSGVSPYNTPAREPAISANIATTALPKNTARSTGFENSHAPRASGQAASVGCAAGRVRSELCKSLDAMIEPSIYETRKYLIALGCSGLP